MLALYIIGGLIALICLLLSSPVSIRFQYFHTPLLVLRVWGTPFIILPRPEKQELKLKKSADTVAKPKKKPQLLTELETTFREDGIGAVLHWTGQLAGMVGRTVGRLLKAITVKDLKLHMRIPGEDAATAATNHGKVCSGFYPLYGLLCTAIKVKKQDIYIQPDFLEEGGAVLVAVCCRISLWRVAGAMIALLWDLLRLYFSFDGAKTERTVNYGRK